MQERCYFLLRVVENSNDVGKREGDEVIFGYGMSDRGQKVQRLQAGEAKNNHDPAVEAVFDYVLRLGGAVLS